MRTYPDTNLQDGVVDPPFGGERADAFGGEAWTYNDAVNQQASKQLVDDQWRPYRFVRGKVATGCVAGDAIFEVLAGTQPDYTLSTLPLLPAPGYDPDATPYFGVALEPVSAGKVARIAIVGAGISPTVTGLAAGTSGYITFDLSTGRLRIAIAGEPVVGTVNVQGYVRLFASQRG